MEAQDTSMSNSRLAFVGAAGMKPRNRGLSAEITLGAITDVYTPSTSSGCLGASQINPVKAFVQLVGGQPAPCRGARGSFAAGSRSTPTRCAPSALWFRRPRAWLLHSLGDLLDLAGVLRYFRNQLAATWPQSLPQRMRRVEHTPQHLNRFR
jgi:hypothetical protein